MLGEKHIARKPALMRIADDHGQDVTRACREPVSWLSRSIDFNF